MEEVAMSDEQAIHLETVKNLLAVCRENGRIRGDQCDTLQEAQADPIVFGALSQKDQEYLVHVLRRRNETGRRLAAVFFPAI